MYPEEIKYTKDHEWVRINEDVAEIGITIFAEQLLGDVVFVDLPAVGDDLIQFSKFGEIESVKAVSDLFAPISGEIIEKNIDIDKFPETVNNDPFNKGWLLRVKIKDNSELQKLLDLKDYEKLIDEK
ncbi:MAG: glycine cleavage system protein H [Chloroflexi bacterium]|nr:glycine cleavage system protein H [Chloroflexota bacterium]|tara:strand:+ start:17 stop:397 length:381 start_codon:yes stop_codon:yes gene_type:complete